MNVSLSVIQNHEDTMENTIIIYLANSAPLLPNTFNSCLHMGYNDTINTFKSSDIPLFVIKSSYQLDFTSVNDDFKINSMLTIMDEHGDNQSETIDFETHYTNEIVSSSADFICKHSVLCTRSIYTAEYNGVKCVFTCNTMDDNCLTNITSSKYYIVDSFSGSDHMTLTLNEANKQCLGRFGTHLASLNTKDDETEILNLMSYMQTNECWIGINDTKPIFVNNGISYHQWIDGNINSFLSMVTNSQNDTKYCGIISTDGLKFNPCDWNKISCYICDTRDTAVVTMKDDRNYIMYSESDTKTWQEADQFCQQQFGTHLSTIQMLSDMNSITNISLQIAELLNAKFDNIENTFSIWTGQKIFISYDECIDFWKRQFDIINADGSQFIFNHTLVDLEAIIVETCSPTSSPTQSPTVSPTNSPTNSPTYSPTNAPTHSPTNAPTTSPTNSPTDSPTATPTDSPTSPPTAAPTKPPTDTPTYSPTPRIAPTYSPTYRFCPVNFDLDIIFLVDNSCGLTPIECSEQMNAIAEFIGFVKVSRNNPKMGLIQFTDSVNPNVLISLSDREWNANDNVQIWWKLQDEIRKTGCIRRRYNTNLVDGIKAAINDFLRPGSDNVVRQLIIISNCADKTLNHQPSDEVVCSEFGYSDIPMKTGNDIKVTVINAKSIDSDIPNINTYLLCMVPPMDVTRFLVVNDAANSDDWSNVYKFTRRRLITFCETNPPWIGNSPTSKPTIIPSKSPLKAVGRIPTKSPVEVVPDPFQPTISPFSANFQNPIEPSPSPSPAPTTSPLYVSDQCIVLMVTVNVNNDTEYEFDIGWTTNNCESTYLSMWSCNVIDRAKYQVRNDKYTLLIDDIEKTWIDANNYCESVFDTSLSRVLSTNDQLNIVKLKHNIEDRYYIRFDDKREESIWIGMRMDNVNFIRSKLTWSDKSMSNYSNLVSGCLAIDGFDESLWTIRICTEYSNHYMWSCNNFLTQRPTISPTWSPTVKKYEISSKITVSQKIKNWIITYPFELVYIFVLFITFIITTLAFFHAKSAYFCCEKCVISYADDAKYMCALLFGLQIWDFLSDVSFAYNLPNKMENRIFFLSVIFIIIPWTLNIVYLLLYRYNWANNASVGGWLRQYSVTLVFVTMICGGAEIAVKLMNSRIFGLDMLQMGLSRMQLIEVSKFHVMLTTILENIPQIFCAIFWMKQTGFDTFATASLISSTFAVILIIVGSILIRMDKLTDEQIEIILHYNYNMNNEYKFNKIGLHNMISTAIANILELNPSMVCIDKHIIGLTNITLNVSITHVFTAETDELNEIDMDDVDEDGLISGINVKKSIIYRLKSEHCKQIMDLMINILDIDDDIRIKSIDVIPLQFDGAKLSIYKSTVFDENRLIKHPTQWNGIGMKRRTNLFTTHPKSNQENHDNHENLSLLLTDESVSA